MSKKFTTKELRLRSRAAVRRRKLKVDPQIKGVKTTLVDENRPVIEALEAKLKKMKAAK